MTNFVPDEFFCFSMHKKIKIDMPVESVLTFVRLYNLKRNHTTNPKYGFHRSSSVPSPYQVRTKSV